MAISETLPGTAGVTTYTESVEPGVLVAVVATLDQDTTPPGHLYCELAISPPGSSIFTPRYLLANGWIAQGHPITWQGFLSLDAQSLLSVTIAGNRTGQNLYAAVTRLTGTSIQSVGDYLRALGKP